MHLKIIRGVFVFGWAYICHDEILRISQWKRYECEEFRYIVITYNSRIADNVMVTKQNIFCMRYCTVYVLPPYYLENKTLSYFATIFCWNSISWLTWQTLISWNMNVQQIYLVTHLTCPNVVLYNRYRYRTFLVVICHYYLLSRIPLPSAWSAKSVFGLGCIEERSGKPLSHDGNMSVISFHFTGHSAVCSEYYPDWKQKRQYNVLLAPCAGYPLETGRISIQIPQPQLHCISWSLNRTFCDLFLKRLIVNVYVEPYI